MQRGPSTTVVITVLTALVAVLLLMWSAAAGSPLLTTPRDLGPAPTWEIATPSETAGESLDVELIDEDPDEKESPEALLRVVDVVVLVVVAVGLALLIALLRRALARERGEDVGPVEQDEEELVALLEASGDEVRYRALAQQDPRNSVVACWVALEDAARRSGLEQDLSETSAELTARVLSRWQVDQDAIASLSEAYREARFSEHPVTEEQRRAAVTALERIHEDLRARVRAEEAEREDRAGRTEVETGGTAGGQDR